MVDTANDGLDKAQFSLAVSLGPVGKVSHGSMKALIV